MLRANQPAPTTPVGGAPTEVDAVAQPTLLTLDSKAPDGSPAAEISCLDPTRPNPIFDSSSEPFNTDALKIVSEWLLNLKSFFKDPVLDEHMKVVNDATDALEDANMSREAYCVQLKTLKTELEMSRQANAVLLVQMKAREKQWKDWLQNRPAL